MKEGEHNMQAILYIGHGSRVQRGNEELLAFVGKAKKKNPQIRIQETCFIELASPAIQTGIDSCVRQGAAKIAVVPVLLLSAGHAKLDIPKEIEQAEKRYPDVTFSYGKVMGVDPAMVDLLTARLEMGGLKQTKRPPVYEARESASVLLVGRGSSDPDANSDLTKIARLLWEAAPVSEVNTCYLAATHPTLDEGLDQLLKSPHARVFIVPYLLFSGVLMKELRQKLGELSERTDKQFILCPYLGFDDQLVEVLVDRVNTLLQEEVS
ncbi:sirohydrochlorin chelatase [Oceanobacillus sp. CFH 90083]|uniref:sirohydrochlorin chelatase n=1 Tax=Oceanobacillus sp. CFH 90083 TaxID=2592336 RepID=UPI001D13D452|nr:sirohydrochlorin chelatase [Oceanobacillus sp. CFH 90083]